MTTPIVVDCDPGIDDAVALLLAVASPELELRCVTAVAGNQAVEKTAANARRVLELAGRADVPVAAGADRPLVRAPSFSSEVHGETGLDGADLPPPSAPLLDTHAVDALAAAIEPGVQVVAIGPLTNLALLLALHPGVERRLERIVLMGGAIAGGNVTPAAEFNVWADPEAASRVFASGVPITMLGLDVTHTVLLTPAHERALAGSGRVGAAAAGMLAFYRRFYERRYGWEGSAMHDALAVAVLIDPSLVTTKAFDVQVGLEPDSGRGQTIVDVWGVSGRAPNVDVAIAVDAERVLALIVERISGLG